MQRTLTGKQGSRYAFETSTELSNWTSANLSVTIRNRGGSVVSCSANQSSVFGSTITPVSLRVPWIAGSCSSECAKQVATPETFNISGLATEARSFTIAHVSQVTHILEAIQQGNPKAAEELLPLVYGELRKLAAHKMASERPGQTLQPTALVHEAWLRLVGDRRLSSRTARISLPQQPRPCGASWWSPLDGRSA